MPGKRVTMRKAREVLRLHFEQQLRQRQIAASLNLSQSAVSECLTRFRETGIPWPLHPPLDEVQLEAVLYPSSAATPETAAANNKTQPDFAAIQRQLQTNRHLTLEAVWAEDYAGGEPNKQAYSYSWFCKLYERFKRIQNPVMRQEHIAGEKLFVDWAGDTIAIQNADGTTSKASLFIAAFGASSYTYIEATADQKLPAWIGAHIRAFEFFGGTPKLVIPDNTKSGVTVACRYDPVLQRTYEAMAEHYRIGVMPARKYKAKDKAIVENAVLVMQRFLARRFRNRSFLSWTELHAELRAVNEAINHRPMRKRAAGDTRASLFSELDKPALQALPEERYDMSQWSIARVNIDYHVAFDFNFYSVPYTLTQKDVEIRATPATVEIFHRSQRVASHIRILLPLRHKSSTHNEHRPKSHRAHLEWPPSRMHAWALTSGPETARLFDAILAAQPHPEMGYRACLGLIRLGRKYSMARLEAASARALAIGAPRYKSVKSILEKGLDSQPLPGSESPSSNSTSQRTVMTHDNVRGSEYFTG